MTIFHLAQLKHESLWQYLSRLVLNICFPSMKKRKIYDVVLKGIIRDIQATLESMYYDGMCYLSLDDV